MANKIDTTISLKFDSTELALAMQKLQQLKKLKEPQILAKTAAAFIRSVVAQTPISIKKRNYTRFPVVKKVKHIMSVLWDVVGDFSERRKWYWYAAARRGKIYVVEKYNQKKGKHSVMINGLGTKGEQSLKRQISIGRRGLSRLTWKNAGKSAMIKQGFDTENYLDYYNSITDRYAKRYSYAENKSKKNINPFIRVGSMLKYAGKIAPNSVNNALVKATHALNNELLEYHRAMWKFWLS